MKLPSQNHVAVAATIVTVTLGLAFTFAGAQPPAGTKPGQPAGPPPPKNLQFFPKDTPRPEIIAAMRQFSFSLGVRCEHCHVDEGPNGRQDFASDDKPAKLKARAMLVMTRDINKDLLAKIPDRSHPPVTVTCYTCHHGLPKPETLAERLHAAVNAGGGDSAVAELTKLRNTAEFGRFDVSEWSITEAARSLASQDHAKEALAILNANAGFYPKSTGIPMNMAEVHLAAGDTAAAVSLIRKVLETEPENRRAKQLLERLQGPGGKP